MRPDAWEMKEGTESSVSIHMPIYNYIQLVSASPPIQDPT